MTSAAQVRLVTLSAEDGREIQESAMLLATAILDQPKLPLADLADSLAGRAEGPCRLAFVATSTAQVAETLLNPPPAVTAGPAPTVSFLYPGVGEHHPGMVAGLYARVPIFRDALAACGSGLEFLVEGGAGAAAPIPGGLDLASLLRPAARAEWLDSPEVAQPAVFAVEYALTELLRAVGLIPSALCGYSVGEFAAAAAAGVFALDHVREVLVRRAELMEKTAAGGMLSVLESRAALEARLVAMGVPDLVVSAVDGPRVCVVSGPLAAVDELEADLAADGIATRRVPTLRAFHSPLVRPAEPDIAACVALGTLRPPKIPMTSNVSGGWLAAADAVRPQYWAQHASHPVLFADNLAQLWEQPRPLLIEVGPGRMLSSLALALPSRSEHAGVLALLPEPARPGTDIVGVLTAIGRAWAAGAPVDLARVANLQD